MAILHAKGARSLDQPTIMHMLKPEFARVPNSHAERPRGFGTRSAGRPAVGDVPVRVVDHVGFVILELP